MNWCFWIFIFSPAIHSDSRPLHPRCILKHLNPHRPPTTAYKNIISSSLHPHLHWWLGAKSCHYWPLHPWPGTNWLRPVNHCWWKCKLGQPLWKILRRFLKKLKTQWPYDPTIPLLSICLEKTIILKDTWTLMFITALFTIATPWKQIKWPSANKWIQKIYYMHTMEYLTAIKQNEIMSFAAARMDSDIIKLSEVNQK